MMDNTLRWALAATFLLLLPLGGCPSSGAGADNESGPDNTASETVKTKSKSGSTKKKGSKKKKAKKEDKPTEKASGTNTIGEPLKDAIIGEWTVGVPEDKLPKGAKNIEGLQALTNMTMKFDGTTATIEVMGQAEAKPYKVQSTDGNTIVIRTTDATNRVLKITFEHRDKIKIKDEKQPVHLVGTRR